MTLLVIIVLIPSPSYIYKCCHVLELQIETWTVLVAVVCFLVFILKEIVMGGKSSKGSGRRYDFGASSSSWNNNNYGGYPPQSPYPAYQTPQHQRAPASAPFHDYAQPKRKLDRKYSRIADNYRSLDEVIRLRSLHETVLCEFLYIISNYLISFGFASCQLSSSFWLLSCWGLQHWLKQLC